MNERFIVRKFRTDIKDTMSSTYDDRLSVISERTEYEDTETDAESSVEISDTDATTTTKTSSNTTVTSKEESELDVPTTEDTSETSAATTENTSEIEEETSDKTSTTDADNSNSTVTTEGKSKTETGSGTTGTEDTLTTGTDETPEDTSETSSIFETSASATSEVSSAEQPVFHLRPQDILHLEGRHIRSEDFDWGTCPVPSLADILIDAVDTIEGSDLEKLLKIANSEQRDKIFDKLPLNLPFELTLLLIEEGKYWKRLCLGSWPNYQFWRYSDNWKCMFVHKTVQTLIENFIPEQSDICKFTEKLKVFAEYTTFLKIQKLEKMEVKPASLDLSSENFDEQLDDLIAAPPKSIYLDFEKVFECFPRLQELIITISPKYLDYENFHFNIPDFNCFFRGMRKLKFLQKLRISNRAFTNEQIIMLIRMLLTHETLTDIDFSYNFIDENVCEYIGKLLISSCPVESLVLKDNKITDKGVKYIAAALLENSKLKKLDISLNMVGDDGGCFLAKVLMTNTTIFDLNIAENKLRQKAGFAFSEVIEHTKSISTLQMQENNLGEITGRLFRSGMEENENILELDVHFCGFSNEDEGSIYESLLRNKCKAKYATYVKINASVAAFIF